MSPCFIGLYMNKRRKNATNKKEIKMCIFFVASKNQHFLYTHFYIKERMVNKNEENTNTTHERT